MATKKTVQDESLTLNIPLEGAMAKLQKARVLLQEKGLAKSGQNDFAHFEYFQLKDFLPTVNKIFDNLGLFSHFQITPKIVAGTELNPIIKEMAQLEIYDTQKPSDKIIYEMEVAQLMIGNNTKQNLYQAAGGRSTYYKRYLYRDALEIEEADESEAVLGQPGTNYQPYVEQPQYVVPESVPAQPLQSVPVYQPNMTEITVQTGPSAAELAQQYNNTYNEIPSNLNMEDTLSEDCRMYVMDLISKKQVDAFETINAYCEINAISGPDQLKNKHFDGLVNYINSI